MPDGNEWDTLREVTDSALFPYYKNNIRFGALSLNGIGLTNYGDCYIILKEKLIEHRASVFEENSVVFMQHHRIEIGKSNKLPMGYRAVWKERGKLCVTKLIVNLNKNTKKEDYQKILLEEGKTSEEDRFVEVHIWGPITSRTFERLIVEEPKSRESRVILQALREKLNNIGISVHNKAEVA